MIERVMKEKLKEFENVELNDGETFRVRKDIEKIYDDLKKIIQYKKDFGKYVELNNENKVKNENEIKDYETIMNDQKVWKILKNDLGFIEPEQKKNDDDRRLTSEEKRQINKEIDLLNKKISYSNWNYGPDPYRKERNVKVGGQKLYSFWDSNRDKRRKLERLLRDDRLAGSVSKKVEPPVMIKSKKSEQIDNLTFLYCNLIDFDRTKDAQIKDLENGERNETTENLLKYCENEKKMLKEIFPLIEQTYDTLGINRRNREEIINGILEENNKKIDYKKENSDFLKEMERYK